MSRFGQTLFGGSRFVRWALSPFVLLFAVAMPLLMEPDQWTPARLAAMAGLELICLTLLAGFWLPAKIGRWAFRSLAGLVFLAYAAYLVYELMFTSAPFRISRRRGEASPFNALLGFVFIGWPALWYALLGRFTLLAEPSSAQLAVEREAEVARMLQPDWEFYEQHLQRPPPDALREIFADRTLVAAAGLAYPGGTGISTFNPLDEEGLFDTHAQLGRDVVAFATSDCGDPIYLRPGAAEPDTVYITFHDSDETKVFADSVAVMLERLKLANHGRYDSETP